MQTAKLFQNGRSQAVRLPKEFRFEGQTEVRIERDGDRIILSPATRPSIDQLIETMGTFENLPDRDQPAEFDVRESF